MELSSIEEVPQSPVRYQVRRKPPKLKCEACRRSKQKCEPLGRDWAKGEKCYRCFDRGEDCGEPVAAPRKRRRRSNTARPLSMSQASNGATRVISSLAGPEEELRSLCSPISGNQLPIPHPRSRTSTADNFFSERNRASLQPSQSESERLTSRPWMVANTSTFSNQECVEASIRSTNLSAYIYLMLEYARGADAAIGPKGQLECDVDSTREQMEHLSFALEKKLFAIFKNITQECSINQAHERTRSTSHEQTIDSLCRTSRMFGRFDPSNFKSHSPQEQTATLLRREIEQCRWHRLYAELCMLLRELSVLPDSRMAEHEQDLLAQSYTTTSSDMKQFLSETGIYPDEDRIFRSDVPFPPLHRAIFDKQIGAVKALIKDPNYQAIQPDILGRQPVHVAAVCPSLDILRCIVDKCRRDDLNCRDMFQRTPLAYATQNGNLENFRFLHEAGARLDNRDGFGHSILANAAGSGKLEIVRYILDNNIDPNDSRTAMGALHKAAENGHLTVAALLLERGAQDRHLKSGKTARNIAEERGFFEIAEAIKAKSAPQISSDVGSTLTNNFHETPSMMQNIPVPVPPSDFSHTHETEPAHRNVNQPLTSPANAAAGSVGDKMMMWPAPDRYWTNSQSAYQPKPFNGVTSNIVPYGDYNQILFSNSLPLQASLFGQYMPPTTPSTLGSTSSGYPETCAMQTPPSSNRDSFSSQRSHPIPPSFDRFSQ